MDLKPPASPPPAVAPPASPPPAVAPPALVPAKTSALQAAAPDAALSARATAAAAPLAPLLASESELTAAMPAALRDQLTSLENWAQANRRDSQWDAVKFWALKIPAIVVSAGSGVSAYFNLHSVAVIGGAVASLCVLIDALNPRGALRNAHLRAFNDLRTLQDEMKSDWQIGFLRQGEDLNLLAARIIEGAKKEKERISDAITNAETSLAAPTRRGRR